MHRHPTESEARDESSLTEKKRHPLGAPRPAESLPSPPGFATSRRVVILSPCTNENRKPKPALGPPGGFRSQRPRRHATLKTIRKNTRRKIEFRSWCGHCDPRCPASLGHCLLAQLAAIRPLAGVNPGPALSVHARRQRGQPPPARQNPPLRQPGVAKKRRHADPDPPHQAEPGPPTRRHILFLPLKTAAGGSITVNADHIASAPRRIVFRSVDQRRPPRTRLRRGHAAAGGCWS